MKNMTGLILAFVLFSVACKNSKNTAPTKPYFLTEYMDTTVRPGDDFFGYAVGNFIKRHPISDTENGNGIFLMARDSVQTALRGICEKAATDAPSAQKGSNVQKLGDFFASGMDTSAIEQQKTQPLQPWFDKINAASDMKAVLALVAEMQGYGMQPLFGFRVGQDDKISTQYAAFVWQGGLGLPDRDYYFNTDARTKGIREEYANHLFKMFELMGDNDVTAKNNMVTILRIELALAKASHKLEDLRDPYRNYNKMSNADFAAKYPALDWTGLKEALSVKAVDSVVVGQPEFFAAINQLVKSTPVADWKTYLRWNLINATADWLSSDFSNQNFSFYNTALSGQKKQRARWKRVMNYANQFIGDILGQEYVKANFSDVDKKRCEAIVDNLSATFADHIKNLDWMTPATKEKALVKLNTVVKKVGFPDKWKDYSSLELDRGAFVLNCLRAVKWRYDYQLAKLGKPVDRTEWEMTPQTYNAYYNPSNNEIVLPAAMLLTPGQRFADCDDAYLYGYIAASTVGHEITHGFDDQGRLYDAKGNLTNWWTAEDSIQFSKKTAALVQQFNNYVVLDSMHVNGKATLGENIADLGGVAIGIDAYRRTDEGKSNATIGGLPGDQRYFMGYAYSWMMFYRPEELARRIMTDVHSPAFLRVNGPCTNVDAFYEAFGVKEGDRLYRPAGERVKIW